MKTLETKLIKALKSNNENIIHDVFNEIYDEYKRLVYKQISFYVKNNYDCEELTQDTFISFFNNLNKIKIINIKYYLLVSAKNKALDHLKKKKMDIEYEDNIVYDELDNNDYLKYNELLSELKKYLNELETKIIIYHLVYNFSFKEISNKLNIKINTVISIYNRAIEKFKNIQKKKGASKNEE